MVNESDQDVYGQGFSIHLCLDISVKKSSAECKVQSAEGKAGRGEEMEGESGREGEWAKRLQARERGEGSKSRDRDRTRNTNIFLTGFT